MMEGASVAQLGLVGMPYLDKEDRHARNRAIAAERLKALKAEAGGACVRCGSRDSALQFHHRDRATKLFCIAGEAANFTMERLRGEAKKCDLVCKGCHDDAHREERRVRSGWCPDVDAEELDALIPAYEGARR